MHWIVVLKKIERPDRSVRLELVLDPKIPSRSKLDGIINDPALAGKFSPLTVNPNTTVNAGDANKQMTQHALYVDDVDMFVFIKVLASMKDNDWCVFTSNAYVATPTENSVQTFYFERTSVFAETRYQFISSYTWYTRVCVRMFCISMVTASLLSLMPFASS
jgi:hypothetical protein